MTTVHEPRPLYTALLTQLATTGRPIGDAVSPGADFPNAILYALPDFGYEASLSDATQVSDQLFQVTCVGDTREEAQWMQHKVRGALADFTPNVTGATRVELDSGSGVLRDDDGPVFFTTDRFRISVS